jgi:hypothetical protein
MKLASGPSGRDRRRRRRGRNELTLAVARREEWQEQAKPARLLDKWLEPACTFWTATDPVAPSVTSGAMRKKRGVKPGVPDVLVWCPGVSITIELKSRRGQCSPSQRLAREALLRAGAQWWVCRSANAAMWALAQSGVRFRTLTNDDRTRSSPGSTPNCRRRRCRSVIRMKDGRGRRSGSRRRRLPR